MENIEGVITSKGQLVIPSKLRQALNIGHGNGAIRAHHRRDSDLP